MGSTILGAMAVYGYAEPTVIEVMLRGGGESIETVGRQCRLYSGSSSGGRFVRAV